MGKHYNDVESITFRSKEYNGKQGIITNLTQEKALKF